MPGEHFVFSKCQFVISFTKPKQKLVPLSFLSGAGFAVSNISAPWSCAHLLHQALPPPPGLGGMKSNMQVCFSRNLFFLSPSGIRRRDQKKKRDLFFFLSVRFGQCGDAPASQPSFFGEQHIMQGERDEQKTLGRISCLFVLLFLFFVAVMMKIMMTSHFAGPCFITASREFLAYPMFAIEPSECRILQCMCVCYYKGPPLTPSGHTPPPDWDANTRAGAQSIIRKGCSNSSDQREGEGGLEGAGLVPVSFAASLCSDLYMRLSKFTTARHVLVFLG